MIFQICYEKNSNVSSYVEGETLGDEEIDPLDESVAADNRGSG